MEPEEPNPGPDMDRSEILSRFKSTFELLDWQNAQVKEHLLAPFYLTVSQVTVLMILENEGGTVEISSLASRSGLPPGTVTSVMDRLQLRRLVRRNEDPIARGRIRGEITDEGRKILRELESRRIRLFEELVAIYSDQELVQLLGLFQRWTVVAGRLINGEDQDSDMDRTV